MTQAVLGQLPKRQGNQPRQFHFIASMPSATYSAIASEPSRAADVINVSIVSNSRLLCEGLDVLLRRHMPLQVVGTYSANFPTSGSLPNPPDHVVLLDASIGWEASESWTLRLQYLAPPPYIVVIELENNVDLILSYIEAGVQAYILQGMPVAEVAQTIELVKQGMAKCTPEVAAHLFARLAKHSNRRRSDAAEHRLTMRELEVLRLIAEGDSNKEIAEALVIEVRTVKGHIHSILDKLQLCHREDAVRFAIAHGWLDDSPSDSIST